MRGNGLEFLNISDIKLKVTLTSEECVSYGINTDSKDFSGARIRRTVRDILATVTEKSGFKVDGERLLVQIYPLPDKRCEILVTRLTGISRRDRAVLSGTDGISILEDKRTAFRFDTGEDLLRAVRAVYREGIESDLYLDDLGRYYIHAREEIADDFSQLEPFIEFGDRLSALPIAVLSEYGTLLCKGDAIDKIYRDGIKLNM